MDWTLFWLLLDFAIAGWWIWLLLGIGIYTAIKERSVVEGLVYWLAPFVWLLAAAVFIAAFLLLMKVTQ